MNKITLKKIQIENFRSISKLEIDLTSNPSSIEKEIILGTTKKIDNGKKAVSAFSAIFGRNSAGKTTILEAIFLFKFLFNNKHGFDIYIKNVIRNKKIRESIANESKNRASSYNNFLKEISQLNAGTGEYLEEYTELYLKIMKSLHAEESKSQDKDIKITLILDHNDKEVELSLIINTTGKVIKNNSNLIMTEYVSNIVGKSYKTNTIQTHKFSFIKNPTEAAIIKLLDTIKKPKTLKLLQLADENITDIIITKNKRGQFIIENIMINKEPKQVRHLSAGTENFIKLTSLLMTNNKQNSLLCIDEIDATLHSELVDVLKIIMIEQFKTRNIQTIFTSHSPLAVNTYTKFKQIYSLNKNGDELEIQKLSNNFKSHQNVINRYINGDLSPYPMPQKARNTIVDVLYE